MKFNLNKCGMATTLSPLVLCYAFLARYIEMHIEIHHMEMNLIVSIEY
jgi:hypothetical protein